MKKYLRQSISLLILLTSFSAFSEPPVPPPPPDSSEDVSVIEEEALEESSNKEAWKTAGVLAGTILMTTLGVILSGLHSGKKFDPNQHAK